MGIMTGQLKRTQEEEEKKKKKKNSSKVSLSRNRIKGS